VNDTLHSLAPTASPANGAGQGVSIENSLLAAVPRKEYRRLSAALEPVSLTFGEVLYEPGETIRHVYFPNKSLISLLTLADGHLALEVGLIGREGMVGIPLVLGHTVSSVRALVQGSGMAMRMASARFRKEFRLSLPLQRELYRYTHSLMAQISQTAACNRFHVVETRLARWLLMTHDRVRSDQFRMTHEFLSHMLGVRRVGVTKAAQALQQRKLISYHRGDITVLDRSGLEAAACECYEVVKDMHDGAQTTVPAHSHSPESETSPRKDDGASGMDEDNDGRTAEMQSRDEVQGASP
jgi:CRP-like cAMP-binding protein